MHFKGVLLIYSVFIKSDEHLNPTANIIHMTTGVKCTHAAMVLAVWNDTFYIIQACMMGTRTKKGRTDGDSSYAM